ncbi:MAG: hypothetical protein HQ567_04945 [Candidatus Nealsonbacteria bacterium]|nr:hypothetical protein [Candidatus Nealsonbacteria bacterium]
MTRYFVACGNIREKVEADSVKEAGIKALQQVSRRMADEGFSAEPGEYIATSTTGFFADDALWNLFNRVRKEAGVVFTSECEQLPDGSYQPKPEAVEV